LTSRTWFALAPGIAAGTALGVSDVLTKITLGAGADVLTVLSFRSLVGVAFVASWLRFGPKPDADARVRNISLLIGLMFAGLIFCLFKAIDAIDVPTAILAYFTYPLLTGLSAALFGLEPLRWRGVLCAVTAFFGLAVMIGAHPSGLGFAGVGYALGAASFRTAVLLTTRAYLVGADARLTTWYSMISSTAIFNCDIGGNADLECAADRDRLGVPGGDESRDNGSDIVHLRIDGPHRPVPDRADPESRTADDSPSERRRAWSGGHAGPGSRQRRHAGGPGRLPIVAVRTIPLAIAFRPQTM
jgi:hypothetical protein